MIKRYLFLLIPIVFLASCSGILWEGKNGQELTISIENPFYQPGSSASAGRALALQGTFLYIELALIEDQAAYDSDSDKLMTGNGTWVNTSWGGHAIVAFDLSSWVDTVEATFVDVPRGLDLKARVLLGVDEQSVIDNITFNTESLCQTYNLSDGDIWVVLSAEMLELNVLTLPIRPASALLDVVWSTSIYLEDYLGDSQYLPLLNNSNYISLDVDLATLQVRDVGYYCMTKGDNVLLNSSPGIVTYLYDNDGSLFDISNPTYTFTNPNYQYKYIHILPTILPDYTSPGYLLGTTVLSDTGSWDISYGLLYDNTINAENGNSDLYVYNASLPWGFEEGDLEFSIINISSTGVALQDIDTVEKIRSYTPLFDSDWVSTDFTWTNNTFTYFTISHSPISGSWIIILARDSEGNEFIFSREQVVIPA